jgi:hypothetical protein
VAWLDSGVLLTPFIGLYGDYYFNKEDANTLAAGALASTRLLQGWSSTRATGGVGIQTASGLGVGLAAELGGIGSTTRTWTFSTQARVPFSAQYAFPIGVGGSVESKPPGQGPPTQWVRSYCVVSTGRDR